MEFSISACAVKPAAQSFTIRLSKQLVASILGGERGVRPSATLKLSSSSGILKVADDIHNLKCIKEASEKGSYDLYSKPKKENTLSLVASIAKKLTVIQKLTRHTEDQLRATSAKANTRATIGFTGAKGAVARTQAKKLLSSSPKNRASKSSGPSLRDRLVYMLAARPENEEKSGTSSEQISTILGMEKQSFDFLLPTIADQIGLDGGWKVRGCVMAGIDPNKWVNYSTEERNLVKQKLSDLGLGASVPSREEEIANTDFDRTRGSIGSNAAVGTGGKSAREKPRNKKRKSEERVGHARKPKRRNGSGPAALRIDAGGGSARGSNMTYPEYVQCFADHHKKYGSYKALDAELAANSEIFEALKKAWAQAKEDGDRKARQRLEEKIQKRYNEKNEDIKQKAKQYKELHLELKELRDKIDAYTDWWNARKKKQQEKKQK